MNEIAQLVTTLGFPIVCCGALAWFVKYQTDNNNKNMDQMRREQLDQVKSMTEAVNNNTRALQQLVDKLDLCKAMEKDT